MDFKEQKVHPKELDKELILATALPARRYGASYRTIGKSLGIPHKRIHRIVVEAFVELQTLNTEEKKQAKALELERLDEWMYRLQVEPETGKLKKLDARTVDTLLRISERRAALLGLDAPKTFIPISDEPPFVGDFDLGRLTVEDLEKLEDITVRAIAPRLLGAGAERDEDDAPPAG